MTPRDIAGNTEEEDLQFLSQFANAHSCLRRSIPEIHWHVAGMLSNRLITCWDVKQSTDNSMVSLPDNRAVPLSYLTCVCVGRGGGGGMCYIHVFSLHLCCIVFECDLSAIFCCWCHYRCCVRVHVLCLVILYHDYVMTDFDL